MNTDISVAHDVIFVIMSIIAIAGGLSIVTQKNPVYSIISLAVTMFSLAVIYFLLHSPFIAAMQVILYAGAVIVLFLFVVMMLNLDAEGIKENPDPGQIIFGALVAFLFFLFMGIGIAKFTTKWRFDSLAELSDKAPFGSIQRIGEALISNQLLPFEIISILLVASMVAAVGLTKKGLLYKEGDSPNPESTDNKENCNKEGK